MNKLTMSFHYIKSYMPSSGMKYNYHKLLIPKNGRRKMYLIIMIDIKGIILIQ